ncbi:MAG: hypothetical protein LUG85_00185 [Clostridiales bacterium]|nr:hypothetical protein [Clostridiales bacterium]
MKKSCIVISIILLLCFLTASCSAGSESALTINDTAEVNTEIFTYFLNDAYYSGSYETEDQCVDAATSKCLEYMAVNTRFAQMGNKLSQNDKADIALEVNSLWRSYGAYFTELGISKNTYFKIKQYEYCKEALRFSLYDTDGETPIAETYIEQYFTSNYVGIKYFYEELYTAVSDSEYEALSETEQLIYDAEKEAAEERYQSISEIADYVNSGVYSIDEAFMAVTGEISADISVSATVVGRSDSSFSSDFIEAVFKQTVGSAFIITNSDHSYLYFIERVDLLSDEYDFYDEYRDACLKAVSESYFVSEINTWVQSCSTVRHMSAVNGCLNAVTSVDRSKYAGTDEYVFKSLQYSEE